MKSIQPGTVAVLFEEFSSRDYAGRVTFFDQYFDLVPFTFPAFDPTLAWYRDSAQFNELLKIFLHEKTAGRSLYEKIVEDGGQQFVFSILPHREKQRILFNDRLLDLFISQKTQIQQSFLQSATQTNFPLKQIKDRIALITDTVDWISQSFTGHQQMLRTQFLHIVNKGMEAYHITNILPIYSKRKFIEIYLYCQGYLLMDHYNWLIELYDKSVKEDNTEVLSLPQKITLLQELGVIDYLKSKIREKDAEKINHEISRIISMVTAETEMYYPSVLEYIKALDSGKNPETKFVEPRGLFRDQLDKFK